MTRKVKAEYKTPAGYERAARTMDAAAREAGENGLRGQQESLDKTAELYRRQAAAAKSRS